MCLGTPKKMIMEWVFYKPAKRINYKFMKILFVLMFVFSLFHVDAQSETKKKALRDIRNFYAATPYRKPPFSVDSVVVFRQKLTIEGAFADLREAEVEIHEQDYAQKGNKQVVISAVTKEAFNRLWCLAETYRNKPQTITDTTLWVLMQAIVHYGRLENKRLNVSSRWHTSCFAVPVASTHIYFSLFDLMNRVEAGEVADSLFVNVNKILGEVSFQSWSVPARSDKTDQNIVNVERFRKHVWWVGGNATGYRALLQTAAQLSSCAMADVIGEVAVRSISSVSQTTYNDDFWTEGITADGAGWGHGKQCLVWGYPIHGTTGSLQILEIMKNYPLPVEPESRQINTLLNYLRGSSFFYYKGYEPPVLSRGNMNPLESPYPGRTGNKATDYRYEIASAGVVRKLLNDFPDKLSPEILEELTQFLDEASRFRLAMPGKYARHYNGSRYFFNNDDMVKKTDDYYVLVNMASSRVSGLESARTMAAAFNIFTCDGTTLFFRKGDEYQRVLGAFNLRAWPGITSRLSPLPLKPIENWNGYNSRHAFAAGATFGGNSFAAGFIFEKNNRQWQEHKKPYAPQSDPNPSAFGVKAYKGYFMFGDVLLAMGCGIENKMPEFEGDIITTLDQTGLKPDFKSEGIILNNGFYYQVLDKYTDGKVVMDDQKKMTQWQRMCVENKAPEREEAMFHLYINHGHKVKDASYAYTVSYTQEALRHQPVVLANTKAVQAAESCDGHIMGAVFYEAGKKINTAKGYINVSAPCALLVETQGDNVRISVTDGLMNPQLKEIIIETSIPLRGDQVYKKASGVYCIKVTLGAGQLTGAPVVVEDIQLIIEENHRKLKNRKK